MEAGPVFPCNLAGGNADGMGGWRCGSGAPSCAIRWATGAGDLRHASLCGGSFDGGVCPMPHGFASDKDLLPASKRQRGDCDFHHQWSGKQLILQSMLDADAQRLPLKLVAGAGMGMSMPLLGMSTGAGMAMAPCEVGAGWSLPSTPESAMSDQCYAGPAASWGQQQPGHGSHSHGWEGQMLPHNNINAGYSFAGGQGNDLNRKRGRECGWTPPGGAEAGHGYSGRIQSFTPPLASGFSMCITPPVMAAPILAPPPLAGNQGGGCYNGGVPYPPPGGGRAAMAPVRAAEEVVEEVWWVGERERAAGQSAGALSSLPDLLRSWACYMRARNPRTVELAAHIWARVQPEVRTWSLPSGESPWSTLLAACLWAAAKIEELQGVVPGRAEVCRAVNAATRAAGGRAWLHPPALGDAELTVCNAVRWKLLDGWIPSVPEASAGRGGEPVEFWPEEGEAAGYCLPPPPQQLVGAGLGVCEPADHCPPPQHQQIVGGFPMGVGAVRGGGGGWPFQLLPAF